MKDEFHDYELAGAKAFLSSDMYKAAQAYWLAAQSDKLLRTQLTHFSSYLFCLHYLPRVSDEDIARQLVLYGKMCPVEKYRESRSIKGKKIRIGYLSADFRQHIMADFIRPFIEDYDKDSFEVFVYSLTPPESENELLRNAPVSWRNTYQWAPQDTAQLIREDSIDILVDLCGHTHGGLTLMIASFRPAPIQLSAIGWINSTGLRAMDFYLSDEICCLPGDEAAYTEDVIRLGGCHMCYAPLKGLPEVKPFRHREDVVLGSFSNFDKLNEDVLTVWKDIMIELPEARLILKDTTAIESRRAAILNRLEAASMPMDRIRAELASDDYLMEYNGIDIALDTFPYTGGGTVCQALAMGVPVIALYGTRHGSRLSSSILSAAGHEELIAFSRLEYISKVIDLARDRKRLWSYHEGLSSDIKGSSLMDRKLYMKRIESQYRKIKYKY